MTNNGADCLARALADAGVDTCFANPGTTEMHLLAAFGREGRIESHLCLFEGGVTGAADGYARMSGKPAATLLHLGPGLANGLANLHNAKKAATPVINIVGEHASYHTRFNAPLTADIEGLAAPVSDWVGTPRNTADVPRLTAEMLAAINGPSARVATMVVPNDVAWSEATGAAVEIAPEANETYDAAKLQASVDALKKGAATVLIIGNAFITSRAAELAYAISRKTGCKVLAEAAVARMQRGGGTPPIERIPFHVDFATAALKSFESAVLAGARDPIAFFAYPERPSRLLPPDAKVIEFSPPLSDLEASLQALADALGAAPARYSPAPLPDYDGPAPIAPEGLGAVVAHTLPEGTIVVDESITNGVHLFPTCGESVAHDWLNNRGGSIGYSLPVAVGAAVACPNRRVLAITGDGSAFYTLQSMWTMARSQLDVTVVILANRSYKILNNEMSKIGAGTPSESTIPLMSLTDPAPDWVKLAEGHGIAGERVTDLEGLAKALTASYAHKGPRLIEAIL